MRIRLTILLLVSFSCVAFSQYPQPMKIDPLTAIPDRMIVFRKMGREHRSITQDNMPNGFNAITEKLPMPAYRDNNGKGFDIYESTVDNMPMLVPDKNNMSTMPGAVFPKLESWYTVPAPEKTPAYPYYKKPVVKPF